MTLTASLPRLTSAGVELERIDLLCDSTPILNNVPLLQARMAHDGYLFLPGLLNRQEVLDARREVTRRLAEHGFLDPIRPAMDAVSRRNGGAFMPDLLARNNAQLHKVLYEGPMMAFFDRFLGEPAMHYDYTWFRSVPPGRGTPSHCDVVYMGRGERNRLYTSWTPIGDCDFAQGGLMILEGSNRHQKLKSSYGEMDVDTYCENKPDARSWGKSWGTGGSLHGSPNQIARSIGGRWLTHEFHAGDVLIFSMYTVHASLDNHSDRVRLSSDSRYQPANGRIDERWVGENPIAHGAAGKRGKIC
jgi:hypothetical protein